MVKQKKKIADLKDQAETGLKKKEQEKELKKF